jgi:hypothetical protein
MDKETVRLKCLELVMTTGSEMDKRQPQGKAQELYEWVCSDRKDMSATVAITNRRKKKDG